MVDDVRIPLTKAGCAFLAGLSTLTRTEQLRCHRRKWTMLCVKQEYP